MRTFDARTPYFQRLPCEKISARHAFMMHCLLMRALKQHRRVYLSPCLGSLHVQPCSQPRHLHELRQLQQCVYLALLLQPMAHRMQFQRLFSLLAFSVSDMEWRCVVQRAQALWVLLAML